MKERREQGEVVGCVTRNFFCHRLLRKTTSNFLILSSFAASFYNLFFYYMARERDNQSKFVILSPRHLCKPFQFSVVK